MHVCSFCSFVVAAYTSPTVSKSVFLASVWTLIDTLCFQVRFPRRRSHLDKFIISLIEVESLLQATAKAFLVANKIINLAGLSTKGIY